MSSSIEVRELAEKATEVAEALRHGHVYVLTLDGAPIGTIKPCESPQSAAVDPEGWLRNIERIGAELERHRISGLSAAEAVADQRR